MLCFFLPREQKQIPQGETAKLEDLPGKVQKLFQQAGGEHISEALVEAGQFACIFRLVISQHFCPAKSSDHRAFYVLTWVRLSLASEKFCIND